MKLSSSLRTLVGFLSAPPIIRISVPVNVFAKMMYRQFWDIMYLRTLQLRIGTDFFNILGQTNKHSVCSYWKKYFCLSCNCNICLCLVCHIGGAGNSVELYETRQEVSVIHKISYSNVWNGIQALKKNSLSLLRQSWNEWV